MSDYPDVTISLRWGGKDGKWRWLAEVGQEAQAGEERLHGKAIDAARVAADQLLVRYKLPSSS